MSNNLTKIMSNYKNTEKETAVLIDVSNFEQILKFNEIRVDYEALFDLLTSHYKPPSTKPQNPLSS